ncbi:hypothetical protein EP7_004871 [Isosphaeraceae bacterium EP7]
MVIVACGWPSHRLPVNEGANGIGEIKHLDKVIHAAIFGVLGFLWMRVDGARSIVPQLIIAGIALAVGSELLQLHPAIGRDATLGDLAADLVGFAPGLAAGLLYPGQCRMLADPESGSLVGQQTAGVADEFGP